MESDESSNEQVMKLNQDCETEQKQKSETDSIIPPEVEDSNSNVYSDESKNSITDEDASRTSPENSSNDCEGAKKDQESEKCLNLTVTNRTESISDHEMADVSNSSKEGMQTIPDAESNESNSGETVNWKNNNDSVDTHGSECIDFSSKAISNVSLDSSSAGVPEDHNVEMNVESSEASNSASHMQTSPEATQETMNSSLDDDGEKDVLNLSQALKSSSDVADDKKDEQHSIKYDEGGIQCEAIDFSTSHVSKLKHNDACEPTNKPSIENDLHQEDNLSQIAKSDESEDKMDVNCSSSKDNVETNTSALKSTAGDCNELNNDVCSETPEEVGFLDAFKGHVKIGKYVSVKGDFTLKSSKALIESPSLVAPFLLKEPDTFPKKDEGGGEEEKCEVKDFFRTSVGELLVGLGFSRVNECFQKDMMLRKLRQAKKEGKSETLEQEIEKYKSGYLEAKKANEPFSFSNKKCSFCGFVTESAIVFESHLLAPHITRYREYVCNYCSYLHRDPKEVLKHMKISHDKIGYIQATTAWLDCPYCPFETTSKAKLNTHLVRCLKCHNPNTNQAPQRDFDFPCLTPKPITVAVVKAYEKSLNSSQKSRKTKKYDGFPDSHNQNLQHTLSQRHYKSILSADGGVHNQPGFAGASKNLFSGMDVPSQSVPFGQSGNQYYQAMNNSSVRQALHGSSTSVSSFPSYYMDSNQNKAHSFSRIGGPQQPFYRDTPESSVGNHQQPKLQGPYSAQMNKNTTSLNSQYHPASLVVCEICDGYIKDMEQLRTHMQLIHKVKIHPKMLVSRPPLNCQKCQWRFFTDQGLERHLLGAHGLVTSNMQELSTRGKDSGCCTICGRIFATKLVAHMTQAHKVTLKPAHLSYKCTVCCATFGLYRLFENHVYLVHSGAIKRPSGNSNDTSSSCKKFLKSGVTHERESHIGNIPEKENEIS